MSKPLFYEYTGQEYDAVLKEETEFYQSLSDLLNTDTDNTDIYLDKSKKLSLDYDDLIMKIMDTDNSKNMSQYLFCSLLEALDKTDCPKTAKKLNYLLFNDFFEVPQMIDYVRDAIKTYLTTEIIERNSLRSGLKDLL